jgi:hypothetical protein
VELQCCHVVAQSASLSRHKCVPVSHQQLQFPAAAGGPSTLGRGCVSAVLPFAAPTGRGHHELFCFTAGNNTANGSTLSWSLEGLLLYPFQQTNVKMESSEEYRLLGYDAV